jgi:hypothetical protein
LDFRYRGHPAGAIIFTIVPLKGEKLPFGDFGVWTLEVMEEFGRFGT